MKDHVEIGHLTKYDAFRVNRDQVMDLEVWFKIHTNVSNYRSLIRNNTQTAVTNITRNRMLENKIT